MSDYTYRCAECRRVLDDDQHKPRFVKGALVCPDCCDARCYICSAPLDDYSACTETKCANEPDYDRLLQKEIAGMSYTELAARDKSLSAASTILSRAKMDALGESDYGYRKLDSAYSYLYRESKVISAEMEQHFVAEVA